MPAPPSFEAGGRWPSGDYEPGLLERRAVSAKTFRKSGQSTSGGDVGAEGLTEARFWIPAGQRAGGKMKPPDGHSPASQVRLADSYGVNGTAALGET
jgi:hypothetical protein